MATKRLDPTHGGFKDGFSYGINPTLVKDTQAEFITQAGIISLRTGRFITRDANGYAIVATTVGQKVTGVISFGFIDRLETRESANVGSNGAGEGLTVLTGSFGVPLDKTMFNDLAAGAKAGAKVYVAPTADGKPTLVSTGAVAEIGWVSRVNTSSIDLEIRL